VLAALAHHLRAAGIALDEHVAHGALFDRLVTVPGTYQVQQGGRLVAATAAGHNLSAVLRAGESRVPVGQAQRAELLGTGGAGHGHSLPATQG